MLFNLSDRTVYKPALDSSEFHEANFQIWVLDFNRLSKLFVEKFEISNSNVPNLCFKFRLFFIWILNFGHSIFGFVSGFEFRASYFNQALLFILVAKLSFFKRLKWILHLLDCQMNDGNSVCEATVGYLRKTDFLQ